MSMNEDAMFKALLKNKPQQPKTSQTPIAKEVQPVVAKPSFSKNSEDAMYNVLLKNKPQQTQTVQKTQARPEPVLAPEPVRKIEEPVVQASVAVTPTISEEILKMTLEELDLPTRIVNALHNGGIETVGQLLGAPKQTLMKIKNLGAKSIDHIEEVLREKGIALTV